MNTNFNSLKAPKPVGFYPHAKRVGGFLFLSGVGPRKRGAKTIPGVVLSKNGVVLDYDIKKNIYLLAEAKNTQPNKLTVCILERPRHNSIIKDLKSLSVNINFISDGDVSGVISVAYPKSNIDIYLGIGGGPEGVLAAAALSCLGSQMQTRLVFQNDDEKNRAKKLGIKEPNMKYNMNDMVLSLIHI